MDSYIEHKNINEMVNETFMDRILTIKIPKLADRETTDRNDLLGK